ncbi:Glutamine-dependent NAD(+) synthetase [Methylobrevis pamukkalensis]|uniref:Glutamine-dependent NAD(+) synthetase n=2 Tax=Methylobrevis pamukkalensis TaxID=1439726 RepID=A0A1E3H2R8_9HYPH|nr:NAD+ synthase [Methylobrevis pamukkalensis]ODN70590.1 Glutamine-dependent NAD(+) synthetase [Methylobrevis pamukkalensis]
MPAPRTELRIALGQLNPTLGDIDGNLALARKARATAAAEGADLLVLTELFISGYSPEDLALRPAFQAACRRAIEALAADTADGGPGVLIGTPWFEDDKLTNTVALLDGGRIEAVRHKVDLPNYGVFDEKRVFDVGPLPGPVSFRGVRIGVPICEDIWGEEVVECLLETGAEILIVPNGSPYIRDKHDVRLQIAVARVIESELPLIYVNQVGGQDELVFDGASFGLDADRSLAFLMPAFEEAVTTVTYRRGEDGVWSGKGGAFTPPPPADEANWLACVTGLRDYVQKNGFPGVVLGLSGGLDSALCAVMAVDALGADRVHCVMMPSRFTSAESLEDAAACAALLGVRYDVVPIDGVVDGFAAALGDLFAGTEPGVTEENLQSRARGTLLMAMSNKFGAMLLTTGNKSEVSVGYATLYGDMNGGFNPIKDLYKTEVRRLARWRNAERPSQVLGPAGEVVPQRVIDKAPSAELRADQTDADSLPPYEVLDAILEGLVEEEMSVTEIIRRGHDAEIVRQIENMLYAAEHKRRQAAPGTKITEKNFGRDRRYPITNRFRDHG